jgi:FkbM family methyltransferase
MSTSTRADMSKEEVEQIGNELGLDPSVGSAYAAVLSGPHIIVDDDLEQLLQLMSHEIVADDVEHERRLRRKYVLAIGLRFLTQGERLSCTTERLLARFNETYGVYVPETLEVELPYGARLECYMREYVQMQMWLYGGYEPTESYLVCSSVDESTCMVDAGANIGQYTIQVGKCLGLEGSVHAFEPAKDNYSRLARNVANNGLSNRCVINQMALSDQKIWCETVLPEECQGEFPNHGAFYIREVPESTANAVTSIDLDTYCDKRRLHKVDLMKIDVEGNEVKVLAGARRIIGKSRPMIVMEVNRRALERVGSSLEDLSAEVYSLGLNAIRIGNSSRECEKLEGLTGIEFSNVLLYKDTLPAIMSQEWDQASVQKWITTSNGRR